MVAKKRVPVVEDLFVDTDDGPRIIGNRCKKCGAISFPKLSYCQNPECEKKQENIEEIHLSKKATLRTFAFQVASPPVPFKMEPFEPYAIGIVDFPEGLRMIGMLTTTKNLKIDMEVETSTLTLYQDAENEYITYAFKPVE